MQLPPLFSFFFRCSSRCSQVPPPPPPPLPLPCPPSLPLGFAFPSSLLLLFLFHLSNKLCKIKTQKAKLNHNYGLCYAESLSGQFWTDGSRTEIGSLTFPPFLRAFFPFSDIIYFFCWKLFCFGECKIMERYIYFLKTIIFPKFTF